VIEGYPGRPSVEPEKETAGKEKNGVIEKWGFPKELSLPEKSKLSKNREKNQQSFNENRYRRGET